MNRGSVCSSGEGFVRVLHINARHARRAIPGVACSGEWNGTRRMRVGGEEGRWPNERIKMRAASKGLVQPMAPYSTS